MKKINKILLGVVCVFLLVNSVLGLWYWSLSKASKARKARYSPTLCQTPSTTPTPLLPAPDKLAHPSIIGIQHHKINGKDIYEFIGWVFEANEQKRQISLGQIKASYITPHQIFIPQTANIRAAFVDENGQLQHQPKTFADLIPNKVRVNILCQDSNCSKAEIVSIIETQNL